MVLAIDTMTMNEKSASENIGKFILKNSSGIYVLNLGVCNCSVLETLLSPDLPIVWIRQHMPNPVLTWWKSTVPLSTTSTLSHAIIRNLSYDLQMEYQDFLHVLKNFVPFGIELYQSERKIPATFTLEGISETRRTEILMANGLID